VGIGWYHANEHAIISMRARRSAISAEGKPSHLGINKMQKFTDAGNHLITDLSNRYQLSREAVIHMTTAVNNGGSTMAQFNWPELGCGPQIL